ncbi:type II toxin-antitoxin system HicB family antitoxin [Lentilactobacillus parabuchneri]|uniref:type II toxin-antitoxin system HicB family antitoxin n=1 Tax=Lentilactobacillus parabuchneri TaxID=152331 RepID=UPI001C500586|nr:type II toxin-antitoxin system HicB family antitoxin [Lentilactobacillus parabuchneri]MBW0264636.1 type II toxin-antitoxin system HicB family antitoxin [Lentilactobacillus parabuchneri]
MYIVFPALFYYDPNEENKYSIYFPDFHSSGTMGTDITDAMRMAADLLGNVAADYLDNDQQLPKPSNLNDISLINDDPFKQDPGFTLTYDPKKSFTSMVSVDLNKYLHSNQPVKKTLTIPKWADALGKEKKVNFSKLLTEAILNT